MITVVYPFEIATKQIADVPSVEWARWPSVRSNDRVNWRINTGVRPLVRCPAAATATINAILLLIF